LRRRLRSAERRNDEAMRFGSLRVKTPLSRVSASLCSVTCHDQRRPACFDLGFFLAALVRLWVLGGALRPRFDTLCALPAISDKPGWAESGSSEAPAHSDHMSNTYRCLAFAASCLLLAPMAAAAQTYPSRQITLIVPFAPGGPADFLGRLVGQKMGEALGQQIVVDNRPGANTIIGAQAVAKAAPDGYTLLMAIDGTLVMNPFRSSPTIRSRISSRSRSLRWSPPRSWATSTFP
jgi:hypothetical protein